MLVLMVDPKQKTLKTWVYQIYQSKKKCTHLVIVLVNVLWCQSVVFSCRFDSSTAPTRQGTRRALRWTGSFPPRSVTQRLSTHDAIPNLTFHSHLQTRPFLLPHLHTFTLCWRVYTDLKTKHRIELYTWTRWKLVSNRLAWDHFLSSKLHKRPSSGHGAQVN